MELKKGDYVIIEKNKNLVRSRLLSKYKATLYAMIKVCIFNKSNKVSRFGIFKKFFECINSKISLTYSTCCTKTDAVYQNVFDSERRMTNLTIR